MIEATNTVKPILTKLGDDWWIELRVDGGVSVVRLDTILEISPGGLDQAVVWVDSEHQCISTIHTVSEVWDAIKQAFRT